MGYYNFTFLLLPFFIVFIVLNTELGNSQAPDIISEFACGFKDICAQGTCKPSSNGTFPYFDCDCNPGWKKLQIDTFTWPACLVPDCTIDFDCGGKPPPQPTLPPNNTATCIWCADGNCVKDGDANVCKCNQGSANLFNKRDMPCFKECYFGADCNNLGFGLFGSPPPPPQTTENGTSVAPPSPTTFGPNKTGQGSGSAHDVPSASRVRQTLTMLFMVGMFLSWF